MNQATLEKKIKKIYHDANAYADQVGGVEYGMNILLSPPIKGPALMVVSLQGGGADRRRQKCWPDRFVYADDGNPYPFGKRMRKDFEELILLDVLKTKAVASNIVFPQWPSSKGGFDGWRKQPTADGWLAKSKQWLEELVHLMGPKVILTYGKKPFEELTGETKTKDVVAQASFGGVPVVGCGHLMRGANLNERRAATSRVAKLIGGACSTP